MTCHGASGHCCRKAVQVPDDYVSWQKGFEGQKYRTFWIPILNFTGHMMDCRECDGRVYHCSSTKEIVMDYFEESKLWHTAQGMF